MGHFLPRRHPPHSYIYQICHKKAKLRYNFISVLDPTFLTTGAKPEFFRLYAQIDYEFVNFTEIELYL